MPLARRHSAQATPHAPTIPHDVHGDPRTRTVIRGVVSRIVLVWLAYGTLGIAAPMLVGSAFWFEHFPRADPRDVAGPVALILTCTTMLDLIRPRGWHTYLIQRTGAIFAALVAARWLLVAVLEAPEAFPFVALPALIGPSLVLLRLGTRERLPALPVVLGLVGSVLGVAFTFLAFQALPGVAGLPWSARVWFMLVPGILLVTLATPTALMQILLQLDRSHGTRRPRTDAAADRIRRMLLFPPHVVRPTDLGMGVAIALAFVLFIAFSAAPGLPLTTFVRWATVALVLPLAVRAALRSRGVVDERGLAGPSAARSHQRQLRTASEEQLSVLDRTMRRYILYGWGRRGLARKMVATLRPDAGRHSGALRETIEGHLGSATRLPLRIKARRRALATLLADGGPIDRHMAGQDLDVNGRVGRTAPTSQRGVPA